MAYNVQWMEHPSLTATKNNTTTFVPTESIDRFLSYTLKINEFRIINYLKCFLILNSIGSNHISERELISKKRATDEKEMTQTACVIPKFWLQQEIRKILKTNSEKIDEVVKPEK